MDFSKYPKSSAHAFFSKYIEDFEKEMAAKRVHYPKDPYAKSFSYKRFFELEQQVQSLQKQLAALQK